MNVEDWGREGGKGNDYIAWGMSIDWGYEEEEAKFRWGEQGQARPRPRGGMTGEGGDSRVQ